jgi:catechol 2,3-dioxygenase-like lactoylglutathione lyase family enzyme
MFLRVWDVTLTVSDLEQAVGFYGRVLGLPVKYRFSTYSGFDCGGVEIGLIPGMVAENQTGVPVVDFLVQDVDQVYAILVGKGVPFFEQPHDTAWGGRIALFADPDGNRLQLVQIDWSRYFAACAPPG